MKSNRKQIQRENVSLPQNHVFVWIRFVLGIARDLAWRAVLTRNVPLE